MNATVLVLFYARKSKAKSSSKIPIYMRITVDEQRAEFSTGKFVEGSKWSPAQSRLKGNSEQSRVINKILTFCRQKSLKSKIDSFF